MNQQYLNNYFNTVWRNLENSELSYHELSGSKLLEKINPGETVIDIGCGKHHFKELIPGVVGVDPAFPEADVHMTLEDYAKIAGKTFDVAFCLGSINFGSKEKIEEQIALVSQLLNDNGRIYWRTNPGRNDHKVDECNAIDFYPWSNEEHYRLADKFNFTIKEIAYETSTNRIYAEWIKCPTT